MKDTEKEEVRKIVEETIEKEKVETKEEIRKEKKNKKKVIKTALIVGAILIVLAVLFFILFIRKPKYEVTLNNGGGIITKNIVVEDNVVKEMPEVTPPKDKVLVTWVNKKNEAVREGITLEDDDSWTPLFENAGGEKVTLKFVSGTDEVIPDIVLEKGSNLVLPTKPNKYKDWSFLWWVDKDGFIALIDTKVNQDTTYYAYWWKPESGSEKEEVTIKFNTGTEEKIDSIKLLKGSNYVFPIPTKNNGKKVFKGWLDESGSLLTSESVVEKDITLKAKWVDPYTCPKDCTPSEDGKTCTKTDYKDKEVSTGCAFPYVNKEGHCVDESYSFSMYGSDNPYSDSGECPAGYYNYTECFGMGCDIRCAREVSMETTSSCPDGYEVDSDKCKKTETIECTAN